MKNHTEQHKSEADHFDSLMKELASDPEDVLVVSEQNNWIDEIVRDGLSRLGDVRGKRILEIGCGDALYSVVLTRKMATVVATDVSRVSLEIANRRAKVNHVDSFVHSVQVGADQLGFSSGSFDFVYGGGVLHHLDPQVVAPELLRILKGHGIGIFWEPLAYNPFISIYRRMHKSKYTVNEAPLTYPTISQWGSYFSSIEVIHYQFISALTTNFKRHSWARRLSPLFEEIDRQIRTRISILRPWFRYALIILEK